MLCSFFLDILSVLPTRGDALSKRNVVRQLYSDHKTLREKLSKKLTDLETIRGGITEFVNKTPYNPDDAQEHEIYMAHINDVGTICVNLIKILTDEYKNNKYLTHYVCMSQSTLEQLKNQIKEEVKKIMDVLEKEELIEKFRCEKIFYAQKGTLLSFFNRFYSAYKETKKRVM